MHVIFTHSGSNMEEINDRLMCPMIVKRLRNEKVINKAW